MKRVLVAGGVLVYSSSCDVGYQPDLCIYALTMISELSMYFAMCLLVDRVTPISPFPLCVSV